MIEVASKGNANRRQHYVCTSLSDRANLPTENIWLLSDAVYYDKTENRLYVCFLMPDGWTDWM